MSEFIFFLLSLNLVYISQIYHIATHFHNVQCNSRSLLCKVKKVKSLSRVQLFATPWTVACQALQPMGFSRQECWSGLLFPSAGDFPDPGIEPGSPTLKADFLPSEPPGSRV